MPRHRTTGRPVGTIEARAAFQELEPFLRDMPEEIVAPPRLVPGRVVALVLGAQERVAELRDEIVAECPNFNIGDLDELRLTALAAWYAHIRTEASAEREIPGLVEEAKPLRELLIRAAELLAFVGVFDSDLTEGMRANRAYQDIAEDLVQLSAAFDEAWSDVEGQAPVTRAQIDRASALGTELLAAVGKEEVGGAADDAVDLRNRAFSYLVRRYENVRRVITYLRWFEGDAAELAPSPYAARRRRRGGGEQGPADDGPVGGGDPAGGEDPAGGGDPVGGGDPAGGGNPVGGGDPAPVDPAGD